MSFSEFITHPNRYTNLFNATQTTQILYPQHRTKKNSQTDPAQQKQRKQLILTDDKNIFAYCFQPVQRLQPNFRTNDIRNLYTSSTPRKPVRSLMNCFLHFIHSYMNPLLPSLHANTKPWRTNET